MPLLVVMRHLEALDASAPVMTRGATATLCMHPAGAKKKWSKGRVKDKANNAVVFDKPTYEKLYKEVPTFKLVTTSILVDRLRINGALARAAIRELETQGLIRKVSSHGSQGIYTRATKGEEADEETKEKAPAAKAVEAEE
ncbi:hypothetical protein BASA61_005056 [Batrachochytrium salamandrivorans]|nr:hypothetical protein BASA61_005056 [Batrachochytrium salamandrivorans]KAH9248146.1 hypothetical protein BASA81_014220 [Batrachochytrium salamandrivorans]KAH9265490.1 hypothetical protein BASA83_011085 [Batrachochytrium salamandrivorans]